MADGRAGLEGDGRAGGHGRGDGSLVPGGELVAGHGGGGDVGDGAVRLVVGGFADVDPVAASGGAASDGGEGIWGRADVSSWVVI